MGRFRKRVEQPTEGAPWERPFAPPAPSGPARINPMVKTAAELVDHHDEAVPVPAPAAASAA